MVKRGLFCLVLMLLSLIFISSVSASNAFSDEVKKVTYYAEEYETGNINYAQLIVYISTLQQSAERVFDEDVTRAEQLGELLGPATEETYWVWDQDGQKEVYLDKPLEGWRKLIFDGRKLQLWLGAWPSIRENNIEKVYYNLHVDVQFKNEEELEAIDDKIAEIIELADKVKNGENFEEELAKQSVSVERTLGRYLNSNPEQCKNIMEKYVGNIRDSQETILKEYKLGSGKYGSVKARLEYCESCENSWIGINVYREHQGRYEEDQSQDYEVQDYKEFRAWSEEKIKEELKDNIEEYAESADDAKIDRRLESRIGALSNALNEKGNEIWKEVDKEFNEKHNSLADEERRNYDWQADNKKREDRMRELQKSRYSDLKAFYDGIFSVYPVKETRFKQTNYEKRLFSTFKEIKPEMCNNGIDDNENSFADCSDAECNGQKCGEIAEGNETKQMYCNRGKCEVREEIERKEPMCENKFESIECDGKVIFKGKDKNGCQFEPICLPVEQKCAINEDCAQPLCGIAECIEGVCKVNNLNECRQEECSSGDKRAQKCGEEEINIEVCEEGIWRKTGAECSQSIGEIKEESEEFLGDECKAKEDCSGDTSVCSNGKCVVLPQLAEEIMPEQINIPESFENINKEEDQESKPEDKNEEEKIEDRREEEKQAEPSSPESSTPESFPQESSPVSGLILAFKRIVGYVINAFNIQENETENPGGNNESVESIAADNKSTNDLERFPEVEGNKSITIEDDKSMEEPERDKEREIETREPQKVEEGGFGIWGGCKVSLERSEGHLSFNAWGQQFEKYQSIKERYYRQDGEWCKDELKSLLIQRKELENSLNNEFAKWFFESYVANTADGWESKTSGIYEVYWKDVELSRRIAESMKCLGIKDLPEHRLILLEYDTLYGSLTFWEEEKVAQIQDNFPAMPLISPYMKVWLLPPKEFIKGELRKAMNQQRFPGPGDEESDRDQDNGPSEEDRKFLQEDKSFMKKLRKITDKYGGSIDASVQLKDADDLVFNLYVKVNEQDIMRMNPTPPELMPEKDITVIVDFNKMYELIEEQERESKSDRIESPPWDRERSENKIRDVKEAVKIFFKIRGLISNAEITPDEARNDVMSLIRTFLWKMITSNNDEGN